MSLQTILIILLVIFVAALIIGNVAASIFRALRNRTKVKGKVMAFFVDMDGSEDYELLPISKGPDNTIKHGCVYRKGDKTTYVLEPSRGRLMRYPLEARTHEQVPVTAYRFVINYPNPVDPFLHAKDESWTARLVQQGQDSQALDSLAKALALRDLAAQGMLGKLPMMLLIGMVIGFGALGIFIYQTKQDIKTYAADTSTQLQQMRENPLGVPTPVVPRR